MPPTCVGTLRVIQAVLPLLRSSARATIVDISSVAGERVYEGGGGYVAAKHGTSVVSETLRLELNGEHIRVVDMRPGMVRTEEFSLTRLHGDRTAADKVYEGVDHRSSLTTSQSASASSSRCRSTSTSTRWSSSRSPRRRRTRSTEAPSTGSDA